MTSTEAMIYQLKQLKGKPLKKKVEHILTYFRLPIVITLIFLAVIGYYVIHLATVKDVALSVVCMNTHADSEAVENLAAGFAEEAEIDPKEYEVQIATDFMLDSEDPSMDYTSMQAVDVRIAANAVDLLAGDLNIATVYFYREVYEDLNRVLTEQQKAKYAEYFLYMDMAVMRLMSDEEGETIRLPDPTKPEEMEEPVPVALLVNGDSIFADACYRNMSNGIAIGIVVNAKNLENALAFLDHIMQ